MKKAIWLALVLALILVSCPTPTPPGPPPPPPPVTPPPPPPPPVGSDLLISEVGSTYYYDVITWFEVFNPTSSAINLSGYQVRAQGISLLDGTPTPGPTTWTLPSFSIAPGAFVVIGTKANSDVFNTNKSVYISNAPGIVLAWTADGFVELTKAGATVDFVRFGASTDTPVTASKWNGPSAPALPFGNQDYGKSIVRRASADTDSAADWSLRDFATPTGPNDVPAGAVDADNDGIPDSAEVVGGTYNGLDLYAMGARTDKRDIFIEVDNMQSTDPGLNPQKEALDSVVAAFAARNFAVHFDAGNAFAASFNPTLYNLGNSTRTVPFAPSISLSPSAGLASSVYALKAQNMDFARNLIFHYLMIGSSQKADGSGGSSGLAELIGNDFLIAFGGYGLSRNDANKTNLLINWTAATIMHELGHNLGLRHGGNEDTNYKPDYFSIMNYEYQLNCLGSATGSSAGDRYYFEGSIKDPPLPGFSSKGITSYGALFNGPTGTACLIDYSNGSSTNLNEFALNENNGLGRGGVFTDWNVNGTAQTSVAVDINFDGKGGTLKDFDDWSNIVLPFARSVSAFNNGVSKLSVKRPLVPVVNDAQPIAKEETPSPEFFRRLRESMAQR
jgi:hypothetical protein